MVHGILSDSKIDPIHDTIRTQINVGLRLLISKKSAHPYGPYSAPFVYDFSAVKT